MNETQINDLKRRFAPYIKDKKLPYVNFQIKLSDCTITVYDSKKVVFQGENIDLFVDKTSNSTTCEKDDYPQAGSDEVGTGDYLGPVCVCACFVTKEDLAFLEKLQINDSKQLTDDMILETAPKLMKQLPHSLLILDNVKYNQVHTTNNMNQIKAKLHNKAYVHLRNKVAQLPELCVVDQFTPEKSYYRYLRGEKEIVTSLTFTTKAESKYLAVACASMIARYAFLQAMKKMEDFYHVSFPKGAGSKVDVFAQQFVNQYGFEELTKIAKIHFKNSEKLK